MKYSTSKRLKMLMEERNLKQVDIIRKCEPYCKEFDVKLNKNYLSQYVSGKVEPGQRTLTVLALALNVSEPWLMGFDVPRERNSIPQSYESPVLTALYNSTLKESDITYEFIKKKTLDNAEAIDYELLIEFKKLNSDGKREAINRIIELTYVPKYRAED